MIEYIAPVLNIWDRYKKWRRAKKNPPVESIATRFIRIFETHGVHRNQIPHFFGHGLILKNVQNDASLIAKLDEPLLVAVCERFAVRREWLDGAESEIHPKHDFYKKPEEFSEFIKSLIANNPDANLHGVLLAPQELGDANALLILQETIGFIGDKPVCRHHLCNNWPFSYWKARAYLTACVAIAWKHHAYIRGVHMPAREIKRLAEGKTLLGWQGDGISNLGHKHWDPDDMALRPDAFLKGIDPEQDNFGIKSGLARWLELEKNGYMDTGFKADARLLFQQELAKY